MSSNKYDANQFSTESIADTETTTGVDAISERTVEKMLVKKGICSPDEISTESIVNILIQKGICTAEEILGIEGTIRNHKSFKQVKSGKRKNTANFINIQNPYDRGKYPGLKRYLSKYRWTRRLGTKLFGWKWRKVKKSDSF